MLKFAFLSTIWIAVAASQTADPDRWWKSANIYQISPVSFKDSNNDGFGDIQGVISKLDYIVETGFDVIFLSPFFQTPFVDFGYDISNHVEVDPKFGSLADVEALMREAKQRGLKVILDFVPNHTSDNHEWFLKSRNRTRGFEWFYCWHDGYPIDLPNGIRTLPNNWTSVYGGSSWEWVEERDAFYYHAFAKQQPDLNLKERQVVEELLKILAFWLDKGADGFRIDAVSQLFEDPSYTDEVDPAIFNNLPQTYELVDRFRSFIDNYTSTHGGESRVLVPQVWDSSLEDLIKYIQDHNGTQRAQLPTNFNLINKLGKDSKAADYKAAIDEYLKALPEGAVANWFVSNLNSRSKDSRAELSSSSSSELTITRELHHAWEPRDFMH